MHCFSLKRSWLEIDCDILKNNYFIYRSKLPDEVDIMAVVKANAYGHGDIEVSKMLQQNGVSHFAVSNLHEAISLREAGIEGEILILGYTPLKFADLLTKYDITQTLISEEYAQQLYRQTSQKIKCHIAIDTGMHRIGLSINNMNTCERSVREYYLLSI